TAGPRQAGDKPAADRIADGRGDDRDRRCRSLRRQACLGSMREDGIDLEANELGRDFSVTLIASLSPAILNGDGSILDPAEFVQSLHKSSNPLAHGRSGTRAQEADGRQLARLLRARRERPCRRAPKRTEKFAPPHVLPTVRGSHPTTPEKERPGCPSPKSGENATDRKLFCYLLPLNCSCVPRSKGRSA